MLSFMYVFYLNYKQPQLCSDVLQQIFFSSLTYWPVGQQRFRQGSVSELEVERQISVTGTAKLLEKTFLTLNITSSS